MCVFKDHKHCPALFICILDALGCFHCAVSALYAGQEDWQDSEEVTSVCEGWRNRCGLSTDDVFGCFEYSSLGPFKLKHCKFFLMFFFVCLSLISTHMLGVCRAVLVRIEVPSPIALEPFKIASKLGRFVLRDEGVPSPPPQWITHPAGGNKLASQRPCHAAPPTLVGPSMGFLSTHFGFF